MADETERNSIAGKTKGRRRAEDDLPEAIRGRYYLDSRGGRGVDFYVDARVSKPAFRDHGGRLVAERTDPTAIRDMVAIAEYRGWTVLALRGDSTFRREAWLVARVAGLEARGYWPTERDHQELEKAVRTSERRRDRPRANPAVPVRHTHSNEARDASGHLKVIERVLESHAANPDAKARILAHAQTRLMNWLEQGATLRPLKSSREAEASHHRQRDRDRRR